MSLVLGIDSSTQSTKAELRRTDTGALVASGRGSHPPTRPPRSEQDPTAWWAALAEAVEPLGHHLDEVVAVSVAGQQHGLVLLDERGDPLRPAKLWNDTESAPQAAAMTDAIGAEAWAEATGLVPVASFTITKLAWVAEHEPHLLERVAHIMLPHDYLTWRLTGRRVTDRGDASGSGWWSPTTGERRADMWAAAGLPGDLLDKVPHVLGPLDVAGTVADRTLELPETAIVAPGTGDNMAGALGIGLAAGDVAVSLGTSGTAYAVSLTPTRDSTGSVAGFADASGRYLPLVATLNATKVTDWMASILEVGTANDLADLALLAEAGSNGATVVPYFDGERTPNRPDATGSLHGLRHSVGRAELARAAHEGVVCGLLDGVDALSAAGVDLPGRLLLIGGGARSAAYQQVMAHLAGRPIAVPQVDEAVAAGACVQAAAVLTGTDPIEVADAWGIGGAEAVEPLTSAIGADQIRARYHTATSP